MPAGETENSPSGFSVDTLFVHMQKQLDDLIRLLNERHDAQQEAMEKAFMSAQTALEARAASLDKEFHEHLEQYRHETGLVLEASDKAISKSETAVEKRFESVNEFRAQLNDQASMFLPRSEYAANHQNLADRVSDLTDRINRNEGKGAGYAALYGWAVGGIGVIITVIILANTLLSRQ